MAATGTALIGQYDGTSWDNAFPQPAGIAPNYDLLQIVGEGRAPLAVVNHAGAVQGGPSTGLVLTSVAVATLVLTSVAVATLTLTGVTVSGGNTVYAGTITGGAANAFVGKTVIIAGFVTNPTNNGSFVVTASDASTITVATGAQVTEVHAATVGIVGTTLVTYNGTITGGGTSAFAGKQAIIAGFATGANNGTFTLTDSSATTLVTTLTAQVAETHAGTAGIVGTTLVTYNGTIAAGGASVFAGASLSVTGFATSANNITSTPIVSSTTTTLVVALAAQVAETHAGVANIGLLSTNHNGICNTRIGQFQSRLDTTATTAALFADAFTNPSQVDILQVVSPTGENVVNYIDYQGVSH